VAISTALAAERDHVVGESPGEARFARYVGEVLAQRGVTEFTQAHTPHHDGAARHYVECREGAKEGGLANTRFADHRHASTGLDVERGVTQEHAPAFDECHVEQSDGAVLGPGERSVDRSTFKCFEAFPATAHFDSGVQRETNGAERLVG
jgi:hypothetical protein